MVKFGLTVFYLFGLPVNFSAFQFSIFSAFQIWPSVPVCTKAQKLKKLIQNNEKNEYKRSEKEALDLLAI